MGVLAPGVAAEDLATLATAWRSLGLRAADVEWELAAPARIGGTLASQLRSALGPALAAAGVRWPTLHSIPGDSRPPALWFHGWERPSDPVTLVRAEMRCVGAVEPEWPELEHALARLRLPAAGARPLFDALPCPAAWPRPPGAGGAGPGGPTRAGPASDT